MSLKKIREQFGVPARRGGRVRMQREPDYPEAVDGTITMGLDQVIVVRPDGCQGRKRLYFHAIEPGLRYFSPELPAEGMDGQHIRRYLSSLDEGEMVTMGPTFMGDGDDDS